MASVSKSFSLLLIVLLAASILIMTKPTFAQTIPTPSVPEFTAKVIENSTNIYIEFRIKNQPYSYSFDGNNYYLNYAFEFKDHLEQNWSQTGYYPVQNNSGYTIVDLPFKYDGAQQLDVAVQVWVLHIQQVSQYVQTYTPFSEGRYELVNQSMIDVTTSWSNPQTITVPNPNSALFNTTLTVLISAVVMTVVLVYLVLRSEKKKANQQIKLTKWLRGPKPLKIAKTGIAPKKSFFYLEFGLWFKF